MHLASSSSPYYRLPQTPEPARPLPPNAHRPSHHRPRYDAGRSPTARHSLAPSAPLPWHRANNPAERRRAENRIRIGSHPSAHIQKTLHARFRHSAFSVGTDVEQVAAAFGYDIHELTKQLVRTSPVVVVSLESPGVIGRSARFEMLRRQFALSRCLVVTRIHVVTKIIPHAPIDYDARIEVIDHLVESKGLRLGNQALAIKPDQTKLGQQLDELRNLWKRLALQIIQMGVGTRVPEILALGSSRHAIEIAVSFNDGVVATATVSPVIAVRGVDPQFEALRVARVLKLFDEVTSIRRGVRDIEIGMSRVEKPTAIMML
jgi:hypothetical protein